MTSRKLDMARPRPTCFELTQTAGQGTDGANLLQIRVEAQTEKNHDSVLPTFSSYHTIHNTSTAADRPSITCLHLQAQAATETATARLLQSLLNITIYTPKLDSVLLRLGSFEDDTTPDIPYLLEGARLANQLVEDLIAFDTDGLQIQCGVSKLVVFRPGVDARAFVEMCKVFNRGCIDGVVVEGPSSVKKESVLTERGFLVLWHPLERSVKAVVEYLWVL